MSIRRLTQFHEDAEVIAWCRARMLPFLRWMTPTRRRAILALAAVWIGISHPLEEMQDRANLALPTGWVGSGLVIISLFLILWLCYFAAVNFAALPAAIRRRPQLTLHALFWLLLIVLWTTSPESGPWRSVLVGIALTFPFLIWRCGYLLLSGQRGRATGTRFSDHLMYLWPAWGGTSTPFGKGLDYLSRHEAKTEDDLVRAQLAGLKLLFLGLLWAGVLDAMNGLVYGKTGELLHNPALAVPDLGDLLETNTTGPIWLAWISLYCELFRQVLHHASHGHFIIAILRLFGFNVFRSTYKPLYAHSIVEFWNRYFYYFKELLSEFFFLPVFARRFRASPRLRLLAAVFAAAFFGNMYYHVLRRAQGLVLGNFLGFWEALHSRFFYCFLLAIGIYLSMLRGQRPGVTGPPASRLHRYARIFGVWTFFALIYIWDAKSEAPFSSRLRFFFHLFGLA